MSQTHRMCNCSLPYERCCGARDLRPNPAQPPYGWVCPSCGRANSPGVTTCSCYWDRRGPLIGDVWADELYKIKMQFGLVEGAAGEGGA